MPLVILAILVLAFIAWMAGEPLFAEWRRARIRRRPFPLAWRRLLHRRVPYVRRMPADLQLQLKQHMQVFLAEKPFIGCAGLVVTDEMRVTVAAQACLLLLNRRRPHYFPELREVLLYPGAFIVDRVRHDPSGVLQDQRRVLSGESWTRGQVILSWEDVLDGAAIVDDGRNVVIHEFAHQLDQATGHANGAPWIPGRQRLKRWSEVFNAAYARLHAQLRDGSPALLGDYAASDPAEFFAVASEVFFEQPERLHGDDPALYRELAGFYRVDPLAW